MKKMLFQGKAFHYSYLKIILQSDKKSNRKLFFGGVKIYDIKFSPNPYFQFSSDTTT